MLKLINLATNNLIIKMDEIMHDVTEEKPWAKITKFNIVEMPHRRLRVATRYCEAAISCNKLSY